MLCVCVCCSTIISWGRSREKDAYEHLLDQFPSGPLAVVSDSYDIFKACKHIWGDKLKERVMERSEDSVLVIRPDSGDPIETLLEVGVACSGSIGCNENMQIINSARKMCMLFQSYNLLLRITRGF